MKLHDACDIALGCDLTDTGEAVMNIRMRAASIFTDAKSELDELLAEYKLIGDINAETYYSAYMSGEPITAADGKVYIKGEDGKLQLYEVSNA